MGIFASLALILTMVGLTAISYLVTRRNQEIGIRMALGAQARFILAMVLRRNDAGADRRALGLLAAAADD